MSSLLASGDFTSLTAVVARPTVSAGARWCSGRRRKNWSPARYGERTGEHEDCPILYCYSNADQTYLAEARRARTLRARGEIPRKRDSTALAADGRGSQSHSGQQ